MFKSIDPDLEVIGAALDYEGLSREEWLFDKMLDVGHADAWPDFPWGETSIVWSSLRLKYRSLVELFRLLQDGLEEHGANVAEIDDMILRCREEFVACKTRLEAIAAGGAVICPGNMEKIELMGARSDADRADGAGWEAVVAATRALIDIYPAAATGP